MNDLAEFLLARIAEDEEVALEAMGYESRASVSPAKSAAHYARWDPDRVVAECEAKRQMVDRYQKIQGRRQDGDLDERLTLGWVLEQMAKPYANHTDYDEEWRP